MRISLAAMVLSLWLAQASGCTKTEEAKPAATPASPGPVASDTVRSRWASFTPSRGPWPSARLH